MAEIETEVHDYANQDTEMESTIVLIPSSKEIKFRNLSLQFNYQSKLKNR